MCVSALVHVKRENLLVHYMCIQCVHVRVCTYVCMSV